MDQEIKWWIVSWKIRWEGYKKFNHKIKVGLLDQILKDLSIESRSITR